MNRIRNSLQRFQTYMRNNINVAENTGDNNEIEKQPQNAESSHESAQDGAGERKQRSKKTKTKATRRRRFSRRNKISVQVPNGSSPPKCKDFSIFMTALAKARVLHVDNSVVKGPEDKTTSDTIVVETVVRLEDAIKYGKDAVPVDLDKIETNGGKRNENCILPPTGIPQSNKSVSKGHHKASEIPSLKTNVKTNARLVSLQGDSPQQIGDRKYKGMRCDKLPDIFTIQGPLVSRQVVDAKPQHETTTVLQPPPEKYFSVKTIKQRQENLEFVKMFRPSVSCQPRHTVQEPIRTETKMDMVETKKCNPLQYAVEDFEKQVKDLLSECEDPNEKLSTFKCAGSGSIHPANPKCRPKVLDSKPVDTMKKNLKSIVDLAPQDPLPLRLLRKKSLDSIERHEHSLGKTTNKVASRTTTWKVDAGIPHKTGITGNGSDFKTQPLNKKKLAAIENKTTSTGRVITLSSDESLNLETQIPPDNFIRRNRLTSLPPLPTVDKPSGLRRRNTLNHGGTNPSILPPRTYTGRKSEQPLSCTVQKNAIKLSTNTYELQQPQTLKLNTRENQADLVKPTQDMTASKLSDIVTRSSSSKTFSRLTHMRLSKVPRPNIVPRVVPCCTSPKGRIKHTPVPPKVPNIVPRCPRPRGLQEPPLMTSMNHFTNAPRRLSPILSSTKVPNSSSMAPRIMRQLFTYEQSDEEDELDSPFLTSYQRGRSFTTEIQNAKSNPLDNHLPSRDLMSAYRGLIKREAHKPWVTTLPS